MIDGNKKLIFIISINIFATFIYYSPISFYGYWTDALFLISTLTITLINLRNIQNKKTKGVLRIICVANLIVGLFTSLSIWHGLLPVHLIPKGHFQDKEEYGYFIERGNQGILNGCYGEIQYHRQIKWFPILEIKVETDECSSLDYNMLINGT